MTDLLLSKPICQQLSFYDKLVVGVSGGLDSTVLLHSLATNPLLHKKLHVVHVHHGLSVNADAWQEHCQQLCNQLDVPLFVQAVAISRRNVEENARIARYQAFEQVMQHNDCLLLAHHSDDQAETILLQLMRGAGIDGLAGMEPFSCLAKGYLMRPFLSYSRKVLESYATYHKLSWIEDESNQDTGLSRNFIRHQVLPLLHLKWPGASKNLVRTAINCQQAKTNLETLAFIDCAELKQYKTCLPLHKLQDFSPARQANILRMWIKNNQIRSPSAAILNQLIDEIILAKEDVIPAVRWANIIIRRYQKQLYIQKTDVFVPMAQSIVWSNFPKPLLIGALGDAQQYLYAKPGEEGIFLQAGQQIEIRFRQGGERFNWHGQTKILKKLFQEWHVPPWERDRIPLIYIDQRLAIVVGYAISDKFYQTSKENIYQFALNNNA